MRSTLRPHAPRPPALTVLLSAALLTLVLLLWTGASASACGGGDLSESCSANYGFIGGLSSVGGFTGSAVSNVDDSRLPTAGMFVYEDYVKAQAEAKRLLERNLNFRKDISPYRGDNSFDELVRQFDTAADFATVYDDPATDIAPMSVTARIDLAEYELRLARDLYGFLATYAPGSRLRADTRMAGQCGNPNSIENPDPQPNPPTGQVLEPIIDWCDFVPRLRQSAREAANIRIIFGQQFMVEALGLFFNGKLFAGGEDFVKAEVAKLRVTEDQMKRAEQTLNEAFDVAIGNGCRVSDYFDQSEWALLSRTSDGLVTAKHHIAVRLSYLNISQVSDVPAARAASEATFRQGAIQGHAKLARMMSLTRDAPQTAQYCAAEGASAEARHASEIARALAESRQARADIAAGRNIFGFDVTLTPARPYLSAGGDTGLWEEAMARATQAATFEEQAKLDARAFDLSQTQLLASIEDIKLNYDLQIADQLGCSRATSSAQDAEFFACAEQQKKELLACAEYIGAESFPPKNPLPGITTFEECLDRKDSEGNEVVLLSDAKEALSDLRALYREYAGVLEQAKNIDERIKLSNERSARVTGWLIASGVAQTAADVSSATVDMIGAAGASYDFAKAAPAGVAGGINIGLQAIAGALSTAADVEIEDADRNKEVRNLLIDQSELLIDSVTLTAVAQAEALHFRGILAHMDDVIEEAKRQRAYLKLSPGNDPAYRIMRDSKRLEVAEALQEASEKAYLAARRAEYEYGARLSASNFRISDIYRARTGSEIQSFLLRLKERTNSLAGAVTQADLNVDDFTLSVSRHVLGDTDEVLTRAGFDTPQKREAERVRRFRVWVAENTVPNNFEAPYDNKPVLRFRLSTSALEGGLFAKIIQQGYDRYWLMKLSGLGVPLPGNSGFGVNLLTSQAGPLSVDASSYRKVAVTQSGVTHLKTQSGCIFDYRLVSPAFMLGLDWASNQPPENATAVFNANINGQNPWTANGFSTPAFNGRPVSSTDWEVVIFSAAPQVGLGDMNLQNLNDVELRFSATYASRTPGAPDPKSCARVDF